MLTGQRSHYKCGPRSQNFLIMKKYFLPAAPQEVDRKSSFPRAPLRAWGLCVQSLEREPDAARTERRALSGTAGQRLPPAAVPGCSVRAVGVDPRRDLRRNS